MVHTSYHFTVAAPHLKGALDRLARFFIDPLLQRDAILKEARNRGWGRSKGEEVRERGHGEEPTAIGGD